jgi:ubiquinone/menaquinone biosynthesis C-methylase UbiE
MAQLSLTRRLLKVFHPEGIPWIGTVFYNALTATSIFQRHYDAVAQDILGYCPKGSILDIGTGPGWLLIKLHHQAPRLRIIGLDTSTAMVAKARENMDEAGLAKEIEIKEGNASRLPFADNTFETIVSTGSLHHWKEPISALNEIYRVLKSGGNALLYDIVSDTPKAVLREMARGYGRLKMLLLWLHAFEEPFYSHKAFAQLAQPSLFKKGRTRFVGIWCCLILRKEGGGA